VSPGDAAWAHLTITVVGDAAGTVTCDGAACASTYPAGTHLTLAAAPDANAVFVGWSGGCAGASSPCALSLSVDAAVTATFAKATYDLTLATSLVDGATGSITASPPGASCGAGCLRFARGTNVTLTASTSAPSYFSSWSGGCSATGPSCGVVMTSPISVSATFSPANLAFVTSSTGVPASVNPDAWADALCNTTAQAGSVPGHYVAVFDPSWTTRLGTTAQGWVRADGKPFALTQADLAVGGGTGHALYPNVLTEKGVAVPYGTKVHTGLAPSFTCNNWTITSGPTEEISGSLGGTWTTQGTVDRLEPVACGTALPLYCLGTDYHVTVPFVPQAGRKAFLASPGVALVGGIAGLDTICGARATAAGLSGTFLALAATTTQSAAARFSTGAATWVRTDGVPITATAAALFSPTPAWVSFIDLDEAKQVPVNLSTGQVAIGAPSLTAKANAADNCTDFSVSSGIVLVGLAGLPSGWISFPSSGATCTDTRLSMYCLEQ
jgi:hypothetical protein